MALDRKQHVGEAAEHVRADRLALISAGHGRNLVGRDAEMIRPKPHQPLDETDVGGKRGDRAGTRTKTKTMQRQGGFVRMRGHRKGSCARAVEHETQRTQSIGRLAKHTVSAAAKSWLRTLNFSQICKGYPNRRRRSGARAG